MNSKETYLLGGALTRESLSSLYSEKFFRRSETVYGQTFHGELDFLSPRPLRGLLTCVVIEKPAKKAGRN